MTDASPRRPLSAGSERRTVTSLASPSSQPTAATAAAAAASAVPATDGLVTRRRILHPVTPRGAAPATPEQTARPPQVSMLPLAQAGLIDGGGADIVSASTTTPRTDRTDRTDRSETDSVATTARHRRARMLTSVLLAAVGLLFQCFLVCALLLLLIWFLCLICHCG